MINLDCCCLHIFYCNCFYRELKRGLYVTIKFIVNEWYKYQTCKLIFLKISENGQLKNNQIAETVKNDNGVNFVLPDGETYRSLLMEARTSLQLLCDQAKNDLNSIHLMHFFLVLFPQKILI